MVYKTVVAKRPSGKKVKLEINEINVNGETHYYAKAVYNKEMNFFISLSSKFRNDFGFTKN